MPVGRGELYVRHLVVPVVVMAVAGLIGLGAAAVLDPEPGLFLVGPSPSCPSRSRPRPPPRSRSCSARRRSASGLTLSFPEAATIGLILRQAFPPLLVALAIAPVIAAREAVHQHGDPIAIAALATVPALVIAAAVVVFLRTRKSVVF